ncbi:hypothetical protein ACWCQS_35295 [Streptomyces sp. NPDC002076]
MFKRAVIALVAVAALLPFAATAHGHSPAGHGVVADPEVGNRTPGSAPSLVLG